MTECNGCGRCCNPVVTTFTQMEIATQLKTSDDPMSINHPENRRWFLNDLTPLSRKEGLAMVGDYMDGRTILDHLDPITLKVRPELREVHLSRFYKCKNYDEQTRQCAIYDKRPGICEHYPWYGELDDRKAIPPECSYNVDVGKVPVELTSKPQ